VSRTDSVDFGILFTCQDPPSAQALLDRWREILDLSAHAERCGFSSLHVSEHHMRADGYLPQPLIACAAIAARTTRALVGPTLMVAPLRHPVHLAEEAAMVDILSGGRVVLGLGLGNFEPEYRLFGIPFDEQVPRFEACLQLLGQAWRDDIAHEVPITPSPIQRPSLPLWVGAMSHRGAARAGRFGDALLLDPLNPIDALAPFVATYREAAAASGRRPRVVLMRWGWIEHEPGDAARNWWPHVGPALRTYLTDIPRFEVRGGASQLDFRALADDRLLVGDGSTLVDTISRWRDVIGFDRLVVKLQGETGPWGVTLADAIRRFGREVIGELTPVGGVTR
jgi:alkanesulfonate monooxygenase SsuD/methylene tetrahydromethanopterin reductase-like flavin-dependent oxidoreductase (luciferase family)